MIETIEDPTAAERRPRALIDISATGDDAVGRRRGTGLEHGRVADVTRSRLE